jgi:acetylornithine deacetylase
LDQLRKKVLNCINEESVVNLARELISFPSFAGEEGEVAEFLFQYLEERGFNVERQEIEPGRFQPLGTLEGTGNGASILFNGHMDIDPLSRGSEDPFTPMLKDGFLYGAGLFNMKAGVTAMVAASVAIAEADFELKGNLYCNPVVGELQGGIGTLHSIEEGPRPDAVVIPEPTNMDLLLKHGGVLDFAITTLGRSNHISQKEGSVDAIQMMWHVQQALYEMDSEKKWTFEFDPDVPKLPLMNVGSIVGGRGRNHELQGPYCVADVCTLYTDSRINSSQSLESAKKDITTLLEKLKEENPDFDYEVRFPSSTFRDSEQDEIDKIIGLYMPPFSIPEEEYLVKSVCDNHDIVTGMQPKKIVGEENGKYPVVYAGTDAAHYWELGVPAFCYGPGGMLSEENEAADHPPVSVDQIVTCTKVLALTALDICTKTKEEYQKLRS